MPIEAKTGSPVDLALVRLGHLIPFSSRRDEMAETLPPDGFTQLPGVADQISWVARHRFR